MDGRPASGQGGRFCLPMKHPLTQQQRYYFLTLTARTALFLSLTFYALINPVQFDADLRHGPTLSSPLMAAWLFLMVSMVLRLFPSRLESLGCQKLFARQYRPSGERAAPAEIRQANRGALRVLLLWAAANALFFLAHAQGWLKTRFLVCLAGFYGVCDIVCILFFCPFQTWIMHNRCCTTCRIYDWDYLMLCTPLLPVRGWAASSACLLAAIIFLRWEMIYHRHPERFLQSGNCALQCAGCQGHLCRSKRAFAGKLSNVLK